MAELNEEQQVELLLIEQIKGRGWQYLPGNIDVPHRTERKSFREVLLRDRLRAALKRINWTTMASPGWMTAAPTRPLARWKGWALPG